MLLEMDSAVLQMPLFKTVLSMTQILKQLYGTLGEKIMIVKNSSILILCCFFLASCDIFDSGKTFDGGTGTIESPYQIATAEQLQRIAEDENLDKSFIQVKDINASETAEYNDGKGFLPIGSIGSPFRGSYNGNGYTISNIKLNFSVPNVGLFGYIKAGRIENIQIVQSEIPNCSNQITLVNPLKQFSTV